MSDEIKLYTPEEAAEYVGVSVAVLAYYRRTGRIKGIKAGNSHVYTESALNQFKQALESGEGRQKPGPKVKKSGQASSDEDSRGNPPSV